MYFEPNRALGALATIVHSIIYRCCSVGNLIGCSSQSSSGRTVDCYHFVLLYGLGSRLRGGTATTKEVRDGPLLLIMRHAADTAFLSNLYTWMLGVGPIVEKGGGVRGHRYENAG